MPRHKISIVLITASIPLFTFGRSPSPDLSRAEELYRKTEYGRAINVLQALDERDAAVYALLGKAWFMQGQYKQAIADLEKAVASDSLNSDYYDWLGRAYGRLAEGSSVLSALGYAKKTVHAFERAVEIDPSNLEALSDVFEYYLEAPGMVGGGLEKAEKIAGRFAGLNTAEYHWARARIAEKRRDFATAEREFREAFATDSNEVGRALDLAAFLSSRGRYSESDALFRTAGEAYPRSPKVLYARAAAYIQSKRKLDEAEALLNRYLALQTTPEDPSRLEAAALLKSARELRAKRT
ncbi:MAG TPA: tetratricopeptide repeat protein [Bryobacteraceae bacterium]|nr:tetratricopeptide repeat protein [Bryobacteraceae bacterium]